MSFVESSDKPSSSKHFPSETILAMLFGDFNEAYFGTCRHHIEVGIDFLNTVHRGADIGTSITIIKNRDTSFGVFNQVDLAITVGT